MRNYATALRGENYHPNTSTHGAASSSAKQKWTLVQPSKKKISVSSLMNAASKNALRTIRHTTNARHRSVPALQCSNNYNRVTYTGNSFGKPRLSEKEVDNYLFRAAKFGVSSDTFYSVDELKAMKRRFSNNEASSHEYVLLRNLELDYAKRMQKACVSNNNMLCKTLQAFKFSNDTVKLERGGKNMYTIVLKLSKQLDRYLEMKLKDIFAKHKCEGFESWFSGATGWYYSPGVSEWGQIIIARLNDLQSVVKSFAPPDLMYCFPGESKILVWCKRSDLWRCVIDVRFFVERAKKKLPDTPSARRLKRCLLQNSDDGPDSLVHWAHHDPQNTYPLTVVTEESMGRLVELLVELLIQVLPNEAEEKLNGVLASLRRKSMQRKM